MAGLYLIVALAMFSLSGLVAAEPSFPPSFVIPREHRSDHKEASKDQPATVSFDGYDLQIIPSDQFDLAQLETSSLSVFDFLPYIWDFIPNPITVVKTICHKVWKIAKFLIPLDLILLGMALVVGFCAFTPYCTLIIEKPFVRKLKVVRDNIPYIEEAETLFYQAYDKLQELQTL